MLALPGPHYWHEFEENGDFFVSGKKIVIHQEGGQGRGTGWSVWDGAVAAARHLEQRSKLGFLADVFPKSAIELGSGTGLAGIAAAVATGLPVTLTDLPEVLPSLQRNVQANQELGLQLRVEPCNWMHPNISDLKLPYGLVVAADCVWMEHLVRPFVATLEAVTAPGSQVLLAYQSRSRKVDELLFNLLQQCFSVHPAAKYEGEPDRGNIDLYWLNRQFKA